MLAVGDVDPIIDQICDEARKIVPGKNLGAVISKAAKERIEGYIAEAERDGAKILVDGRGTTVEGKENGTYVGPTVIDFVTPDMSVAREEVFGPVISIIRTSTLDEAIKIENENPYGNAAAVFTQSGGLARYVMEHASAGMIGVNIGVPFRENLSPSAAGTSHASAPTTLRAKARSNFGQSSKRRRPNGIPNRGQIGCREYFAADQKEERVLKKL